MNCDVVIVGAGVAGLAAASHLARKGMEVRILEAGTRICGRIFTVHDALSPLPIELGAEFVHGRPPETWELIRKNNLTAFEHTAQALHIDRGRVLKESEVGEIGDRALSQMAKSSRRKDESFEQYLHRSRQPPPVKNWARFYVEGFNACRSNLVSAASLIADSEAADKIEGDRTFRLVGGYDSIAVSLLRSLPNPESSVQLNSVVRRVQWRRGQADVHYESAIDGSPAMVRCRHLIVTVPLGVLQSAPTAPGAIAFEPEPTAALRAAAALRFGQVYRVTFRFPHAFWEENEKLKQAGFLISQDRRFFTWWTTHPIVAPLLTGWMAGSKAEEVRAADPSQIAAEAIASLGRILRREVPRPEAFYFHNWRTDPFFRGAYSYVPVNAMAARDALAKPVEGTLFFAGEAAEVNGHGATVHGAIASGVRAARLVQKLLKPLSR